MNLNRHSFRPASPGRSAFSGVGRRFPLSHRTGGGRGEGKSAVSRLFRGLQLALLLAPFFLVNGPAAAAQTNNAAALTDYSAFRLIVDRNIFDPNRRARAAGGRRQSASRSAPAFSLVGTMTYASGMLAFFDGTESRYRQVLAVNGTIAGYTVTDISLSGVKLASTNKLVVLTVGAKMRWEGNAWQMTGQAAELPAGPAESETPAADSPAAPPSTSEGNDVLKKLMQQREQELK